MERLTLKFSDGKEAYCRKIIDVSIMDRPIFVGEAVDKLAEYEDLEEQGKLLKLPVTVGDIIFVLVLCDDGKYHIFKMIVYKINPFGVLRRGKVWNVYLEYGCTRAYKSFYDFGKTVFLTREEAEEAVAAAALRAAGGASVN